MSEDARNTQTVTATSAVQPWKQRAFDEYLTFCALGGILVDETGRVEPLSLGQFCQRVGVDPKTTWRWKTQTPNFGLLVRQRREEIFPWARETAVWNKLYLIATTSLPNKVDPVINPKTGRTQIVRRGSLHDDQRAAVDAAKTLLGHNGDLRLPVQRQDVKVDGGFLSEMMFAARQQGVIEGEVVPHAADNVSPADVGGEAQDPGVLPSAS